MLTFAYTQTYHAKYGISGSEKYFEKHRKKTKQILFVRTNKTSPCLEQVYKIPGVYFGAVVYKNDFYICIYI
jgi:hypothetical protein